MALICMRQGAHARHQTSNHAKQIDVFGSQSAVGRHNKAVLHSKPFGEHNEPKPQEEGQIVHEMNIQDGGLVSTTSVEFDSGCECGLEEIEGPDMWSRTMAAVRVLSTFKKKRRHRLEMEKLAKEKRRNLWRRLGFKLRVFNIFASSMATQEDPLREAMIRLRRKLGDLTVTSESEANRYQHKIEETLNTKLNVKIKEGDAIFTTFDTIPVKKRRRKKTFERTLSFDEADFNGVAHGAAGVGKLREIIKDMDQGRLSRRSSWHSEDFSSFLADITTKAKYRCPHIAPVVIVSTPQATAPPSLLASSTFPAILSHSDRPTSLPSTSTTSQVSGAGQSANNHQTSPAVTPTSPGPASPPYRHYIHEVRKDGKDSCRRPSIVTRNIKKMFGKN